MQPIWTLYSRRIFSRLAYWLSALGYNLRDRSLNNRLYLIYFIVFWMVWVGAVFAFGGETLANGLVMLSYPPTHIVSAIFQIILAVWGIVQLWQVTHRSPFVFTEEDAFLICQVPSSRRRIGFALFLQGWLGTILPFVSVAILLAFTLVEMELLQAGTAFVLGAYILCSLRVVSIILAFQGGVMAMLWSLGACRLHPRQHPWLRLMAPLVLILAAAAIGLRATQSLPVTILLFPLRLSMDAAFNSRGAAWVAGFSFSLFLLLLGVLSLYLTTPSMSLMQAARETSRRALIQTARSLGNSNLADALVQRQRLSGERSPSKTLSSKGASALFDKDEVQTRRSFTLAFLLKLIWILGLSLGMFRAPTWQMQLVLGGLWALAVGNLSTRRLRSDLARWWIVRTLPVKTGAFLRAELRLSWTLVVLMGWLGVIFSPTQLSIKIYFVMMIPFFVTSAGFAAAYDILRRCQARTIMSPSIAEENIPQVDIWGILLGIVSVLAPLGLAIAVNGDAQLSLVAVLIAVGMAWFNYNAAVNAYTNVG